MIAINIAGTIPINGPTMGIKFANPAIVPMKITRVILAPAVFKMNRPIIDKRATLLAAKICPRRYFEICCSIL